MGTKASPAARSLSASNLHAPTISTSACKIRPPLRNHLVLRDYLRSNTEARDTYARLKFDFAQKHSNDMDSYIRGKTDFILAILGHQGFDSNTLDSIRRSQ